MAGSRPDWNVRCNKTNRKKGGQCGNYALYGQQACAYHGGHRDLARQKRAEDTRLMAVEGAARRLNLGSGLRVDPATALLEEVSRTAGVIQWLEAKISALEADEDLIWGKSEELEGLEQDKATHTTKYAANMHGWLELLQKERAHLVKCCAEALRAGLQERQVRLAEAQGMLVAGVIRQVLGDLQLTEGQWELVQIVVPKALRTLNVHNAVPENVRMLSAGRTAKVASGDAAGTIPPSEKSSPVSPPMEPSS